MITNTYQVSINIMPDLCREAVRLPVATACQIGLARRASEGRRLCRIAGPLARNRCATNSLNRRRFAADPVPRSRVGLDVGRHKAWERSIYYHAPERGISMNEGKARQR